MLLTIVGMGLPIHGGAQSAKVIYLIHPAEATVLVDGEMIPQMGRWLPIAQGVHRVQISARTYLALDTTFVVAGEDSLKFRAALVHDPLYVDYTRAVLLRQGRRMFMKLDAVATPLVAVSWFLAYRHSRRALEVLSNRAKMVQAQYLEPINLSDIARYRAQYEPLRERYRTVYHRMVARNIGAGVVLSVMSGLLVRNIVLQVRTPKPAYLPGQGAVGLRLELGTGDLGLMSLACKLKF